jgi:hypothetical protein
MSDSEADAHLQVLLPQHILNGIDADAATNGKVNDEDGPVPRAASLDANDRVEVFTSSHHGHNDHGDETQEAHQVFVPLLMGFFFFDEGFERFLVRIRPLPALAS